MPAGLCVHCGGTTPQNQQSTMYPTHDVLVALRGRGIEYTWARCAINSIAVTWVSRDNDATSFLSPPASDCCAPCQCLSVCVSFSRFQRIVLPVYPAHSSSLLSWKTFPKTVCNFPLGRNANRSVTINPARSRPPLPSSATCDLCLWSLRTVFDLLRTFVRDILCVGKFVVILVNASTCNLANHFILPVVVQQRSSWRPCLV